MVTRRTDHDQKSCLSRLRHSRRWTTSGGRFPRVQGFIYNDDTGEAFLNGKQCTGVRKELRGIKIDNINIRKGRGSEAR
jgi:hypothetical protein